MLGSLFRSRRKPAGINAHDWSDPAWTDRYEESPFSPLYGEADDASSDFSGDSAPAKPKTRRFTRWWWIKRGFQVGLALFLVIFAWLALTAPLSKSLKPIAAPQITLLASDGTPIARKGAIVEEPVKVSELPPHVIQPFIAIEDRRFYDHWGVDPRGVARAAWSNLTTGRTQGGSTITQQLAKFTFLSSEQNMTRKAREALIAFWLEAWLTKDEILERYLSNAYFGDNTYGLRAASLHYFYRQPENLKPEQAAMLAGLLQAPSRLAPTRNPDLARKRMDLVKRAMVEAGYLTEEQARRMPVPRTDVRQRNNLPTGTYFADWAMPEALEESGGGYQRQSLTTTLDARLQNIASRVTRNAPLGGAQVALVAMRRNGEVVAMVGGKNYEKSPFNRATQAQRQPGSTFKLFVYLAALRQGKKPDDLIDNTEITEGSYRPRNSGGRYSNEITLEDAFAQSSNVAAVRLFNEVGSNAVIKTARDLGVDSPLTRNDPSLALGTSTMNLLELTAAYAGVAANQLPVTPHALPQQESSWFNFLWDGKTSLWSSEHKGMEQMLRSAVNRGTGRAARLSVPNFGKTGTSQDNRDALFIGYAGDLVVGVWVGNDDNTPLKGVSGGGLPARIWKNFMVQALGKGTSVPTPKVTESPDPEGPIQPLDIPDGQEFPLDDNGTTLRIEQNGAVISTQVEGVPFSVRFGEEGLKVEPAAPAAQPTPAASATPMPQPPG